MKSRGLGGECVGNLLLKSVRYGVLLTAWAGSFLLFSCAISDDSPVPVPAPGSPPPPIGNLPDAIKMISVDNYGNGSITLDGLSNNDVYLVKVNPSDTSRDGGVARTASVADADGIRVPAGTVTIGGQTLTRYEMQWPLEIPPSALSRSAMPVNRSAASDYLTAQVDDTKTFYVNHTSKVEQKTATLKKIGNYCKIWVIDDYFDNNSVNTNDKSDNKVTQTQIDALADKFDLIYPVETNLLGYEYGGGQGEDGGADLDTKIQILVYDIDGDYKQHPNGVVLGYFYTGDEYPRTALQHSNEAEIFYLDCEMLDEKPTVLYSTLIHEFNHMINYNVKVLKTGNSANYEAWYTEMLSMLAEDVIGPLADIPANTDGHVIKERIPYWLDSYMNYGVMQWTNGADVLGYYSSNYAFGAYLARNFGGPALISAIAKSPNGGRASLDESLRKFNSSLFSDLDANVTPSAYALARFGEALMYSGNKKPDGVYSFDKTVSQTVGGQDYTFSGFDVWGMTYKTGPSTLTGPRISQNSGGSAQIQPYGVLVTQDSTWKNASGSLVINLSRADRGAYYFVMKR
jgi:hypothetical protein